jgi:signal transduction histidine kinase
MFAGDVVTTAVLDAINARVAMLDDTGTVVFVSPAGSAFAFAESLGVSVPDERDLNYIEVCRTAAAAGSMDAAAIATGLGAVCGGASSQAQFEYRSSGRGGGDRWLTVTVTPRPGGEAGALVLHRDITAGKSADETARMVGGRLLARQDEERRRIARDLHDDVSQRFALLAFELQRLGQSAPSQGADVSARALELWERTAEISTTLHELTYRLHPLKVELLGLNAAISDLRRQLSGRHGIVISLAYEAVPEPLPRESALSLFHIVQEGLANVIRHSGASHASVEITGTGDAIALVIADTGIGFDPEAVGARGLGLPGIRQRVEFMGGSLRVWSRAGEGTRLEATIPFGPIDGASAQTTRVIS